MRTHASLVTRGIFPLVGALLVSSFIGFYPSYFSQIPTFPRSGWQVHFHLFTVAMWLALLVAQASLVLVGRGELHRSLGRLSYLLAPLVVVGFALVTSFGQRRHADPALLGAALFDGSLFVLFYVLAIVTLENAAHHSRYMLLTAVTFINPTLGRAIAPEVSVPLEFLLILGLFVASRLKNWPWRPFLVATIAYPTLMMVLVYCSIVEPSIMQSLWIALWG